MIVLEKRVKGKQEELLKKAKAFFGPEGEGLTISSEGDCCIAFQGAGGFVTVSLNEDEPGYIKVKIESYKNQFTVSCQVPKYFFNS